MRSAYATLDEAVNAATQAAKDGRSRAVWLMEQVQSSGWELPRRFVVGLERTANPPTPHTIYIARAAR
jgi:hypothetical protein